MKRLIIILPQFQGGHRGRLSGVREPHVGLMGVTGISYVLLKIEQGPEQSRRNKM